MASPHFRFVKPAAVPPEFPRAVPRHPGLSYSPNVTLYPTAPRLNLDRIAGVHAVQYVRCRLVSTCRRCGSHHLQLCTWCDSHADAPQAARPGGRRRGRCVPGVGPPLGLARARGADFMEPRRGLPAASTTSLRRFELPVDASGPAPVGRFLWAGVRHHGRRGGRVLRRHRLGVRLQRVRRRVLRRVRVLRVVLPRAGPGARTRRASSARRD